jgi:hypothetical protein
MAVFPTPRMVALMPGQSPPAVSIPILIVASLVKTPQNSSNITAFNDYFRRKGRKKR